MSARAAAVAEARASGRGVLAACGAPLACRVQEQLELLNERWHAAAAALQRLRARVAAADSGAVLRDGGAAWAAAARELLRRVDELLHTTSANPGDRTCLAIRLSLVKVPFCLFYYLISSITASRNLNALAPPKTSTN